MATNRSLQDVLEDAKKIINTWKVNPDFTLGPIQHDDLLTSMIQERDNDLDTLTTTRRALRGFCIATPSCQRFANTRKIHYNNAHLSLLREV